MVPDDLTIDDVLGPRPDWLKMLRRGFAKRCPRCGHKPVYDSFFRMKERCPNCGMRFEREEGFFVGSYFVNFAVVEVLLFVVVMSFVLVLANGGSGNVWLVVGLGLVFAIVGPILFYPRSRTIWSAIDLAMRPLELDEIVAARDHVEGHPGAGAAEGNAP